MVEIVWLLLISMTCFGEGMFNSKPFPARQNIHFQISMYYVIVIVTYLNIENFAAFPTVTDRKTMGFCKSIILNQNIDKYFDDNEKNLVQNFCKELRQNDEKEIRNLSVNIHVPRNFKHVEARSKVNVKTIKLTLMKQIPLHDNLLILTFDSIHNQLTDDSKYVFNASEISYQAPLQNNSKKFLPKFLGAIKNIIACIKYSKEQTTITPLTSTSSNHTTTTTPRTGGKK